MKVAELCKKAYELQINFFSNATPSLDHTPYISPIKLVHKSALLSNVKLEILQQDIPP